MSCETAPVQLPVVDSVEQKQPPVIDDCVKEQTQTAVNVAGKKDLNVDDVSCPTPPADVVDKTAGQHQTAADHEDTRGQVHVHCIKAIYTFSGLTMLVGWVTGRASNPQNTLSDGVLSWLSVARCQ